MKLLLDAKHKNTVVEDGSPDRSPDRHRGRDGRSYPAKVPVPRPVRGESPVESPVAEPIGLLLRPAPGPADFASRSAVSGARRRAAKTEFKAAWEALKAGTLPEQLAAAYQARNIRDDDD